MKIVSSSRMQEIDRESINEFGFGDLILMENAGIKILEESLKLPQFTQNIPVISIAGSGNNGGDALVIARHIFSERPNPVTVILKSASGSPAFEKQYQICIKLGIEIVEFPSEQADALLSGNCIIFDGLTGTGLKSALHESAAGLCERINSSPGTVIAIDIPSGIGEQYCGTWPAVKADLTVTVGLPKRALYLPACRTFCGVIRSVQIGFPEQVINSDIPDEDGLYISLTDEKDIERLMPVLKADSYKNSRGHLAVLGGSEGTLGAASLCAEAAARTSTGLVSLFIDERYYPVLAAKHNSVMVKVLDSETAADRVASLAASAVGPGWGAGDERKKLLLELLGISRGVLDADAITILAQMKKSGEKLPDLGNRWVLTPHQGEFKRLFPELNPEHTYTSVYAAAAELNTVVLLKGHVSMIAAPDGRITVIDGLFPQLGTAGSGDILCGIIGGYCASGMNCYDAAVLGALVHLRAGKRCATEHEWFPADMILQYI